MVKGPEYEDEQGLARLRAWIRNFYICQRLEDTFDVNTRSFRIIQDPS